MQLSHFEKYVKPSILAESATTEDAVNALKSITDSDPITDADGNAVEIELKVEKTQEPEQKSAPEFKVDTQKIADSIVKSLQPHLKDNKAVAPVEPVSKWSGSLKCFKSEKNAAAFAMSIKAASGNRAAQDWLNKNGYKASTLTEGTNSDGGYTVPDPVLAEIVALQEQYGVSRQNARVIPMNRDTLNIPALNTGLAVSFVGEASPIDQTDVAFDTITLTAKKLAGFVQVSSELMDDSLVNIGDFLGQQFAIQLAQKEDDCAFNGDGTSGFGSMVGLYGALKASGGGTFASAASVYESSHTTWAALDIADISAWTAKLPAYAVNQAKIFCSHQFFSAVLERLAFASGGNTRVDVAGKMSPSFFGYPVVFTQVMPTNDSDDSQAQAYIGSLPLCLYFGDRREVSLSTNTMSDTFWTNDLVGIRAIERFGITAAGTGTTSVTGPVAALKIHS